MLNKKESINSIIAELESAEQENEETPNLSIKVSLLQLIFKVRPCHMQLCGATLKIDQLRKADIASSILKHFDEIYQEPEKLNAEG